MNLSKIIAMERMNFQRDYNNKLGNAYFLTTRVKSDKWTVGQEYELFDQEKGFTRGHGRIVRIREITAADINDWQAFLDSGLSADELREELAGLYGEQYKLKRLYLILVHRIIKKPVQQQLF